MSFFKKIFSSEDKSLNKMMDSCTYPPKYALNNTCFSVKPIIIKQLQALLDIYPSFILKVRKFCTFSIHQFI